MLTIVFEVPSKVSERKDPLYQIRSSIEAFNQHMKKCLIPRRYLVVDETMNQWLETGIPNIKNVPREPHSIGQEFKTMADHSTYCILSMDTVSDPYKKEFDDNPELNTLAASVKRLIKPWIGSGRTVIADSYFGSPAVTEMLLDLGLLSIMQVTKRRYWPKGMPSVDIIEKVEEPYGSYYTMHKNIKSGIIFVNTFRDQKTKAFIYSCGTTRLTSERAFMGTSG